MRDFSAQLGDRLMEVADDLSLETGPSPTPAPRRRNRRRPAIFGTGAAGLAAVGSFFVLTGTSLAELPILKTHPTDATQLRAAVPGLAAKGLDFSKAHAFATEAGPGYVLVSPTTDTVCMAIPDAAQPADYGSSCRSPLATVERDGLAAEVSGDLSNDPNASTTYAFVLPESAKDVTLRSGGRTYPADVQSGVVTGTTRNPVVITWSASGRSATKQFDGPFTSDQMQCPNGRMITPPSKPSATPGAPPVIDQQAVRKACR